MSKSSTATAPKNPTPLPARSAWARGPPQAATAPSPRSQSPAPSIPVHQTHSRRPSTLQGVHVKDGVTVPRSNVGVVKQGSPVTFGSIDDVSAPISSSPTAAPSIKSEGVRSFGTVPAANTGHVNGKASISSREPVIPPAASSSSSAALTPPASAAATPAKPKIDIKKMFQNPSSAPSSNPPSDSSSPSMRNVNLPSQPSSSHQGQSSHPPPSQLGAHSYTPFVPSSSMRPPPNNGPNGGPPPRSPQYTRQMANGVGPRSQGGQNGGPSAGLSSPRLGPPHNGQPSPMPPPQMQPQMQPQMHQHMGMPSWNYYGYNPEQPHYMYPPQWYPHMPMQPPHGQHPPQTPGPHIPPHPGMPMSPRNPPSTLQGPGTPTLTHAMPNPVHAPHPPPAISHAPSSISGLTSPPPTPASSSIPTNRLNAGSSAFVPRSTKVTLKKEDGTEVNIENLKSIPTPVVSNTVTPSPQGSVYRQGSPGTPNRRPASIRIESEDQRKLRLAQEEQKEKEQAKLKAEAEEKVKKEKEEAERKVKEAEEKKRKQEERIRKEEEEKKEKERLRLEEEERARKEAEEREAKRIAEEEERKRKAEEEAEAKRIAEEKAKEEEQRRLERLEKERAEKERLEKEKAENERLAKEAEAERLRLEQEEAAKKVVPEPDVQADDKVESASEDGELLEDGKDVEATAPSPLKDETKEKLKDGLRINTGATPPTNDRRRPGPLDLSNAKNNTAAVSSALATARIISDINTVQYPAGVSSPQADLNENAKEGKFRYNRDFLLQFMDYCKEKPANLPPLDAIGLEPVDHSAHSLSRGGSGRHRQSSGAAPSSRQGSIGLGISPSTFARGSTNPFAGMGNFGTAGASKLSSEDRFAMSATANRAASVGGAPGMQYTSRPAAVTRTASQGGPGAPLRDRTRSKRGEKRGENNKAGGGGGNQQSHGSGFSNFQNQQQANLEPVAPLQATENRWDRRALQVDADSPEMVDRKVKGLLNKLTMEKFDSISDQIISWANKSEKEKDGRTLIQVIRLVFEKATDEATWSEMYARLCRKMMEQISSKVQDDGIKNNEGKPIAGGQLFRKYLLNRCQEDFERGWVAKEATAAAAASKALEDEAIKAANDKTKESGKDEEVVLYSDEYYAAQKAKRQGLGLIKFIGELFKLQMLTERIMHECVKKLLGNVDNPEEEEIESLCKLLTTVGGILDNQKARAHLDVYFSRMKELTKSPNVTPRMQYMLQDLVELRDRKWVTRNTVAAPTTIAQIHENAAKEKAAAEKESYQRQVSMSRGGSRRGGDRSDYPQVGPDGWAVAGSSGPPRPPPKAGDLSNFGKISKAQPMTFGPSSVFAGKKGPESKREAISRTSSSSNMFSMLSSQAAESGDAATKAAEPMQRKRLVLQPRSRPVEAETTEPTESPVAESDGAASEEEAPNEMTEADALKKISEDLKEFFAVRNLDEAEIYFTGLPAQYHHILVDKLVSHATESKEAEAKLVSDFFARVTSNDQCTPAAFEQGFTPIAEIIDDIAIDAPKAFQLFAMMIKGAGLDEVRRTNLASKSIDSDKLLALLQ